MAKYTFTPTGVCSRKIDFEVENGVVTHLQYTGGCNGNLKGISALAVGMKVDDLISRLKGVDCGGRGTSCPDQLARALELSKNQ